jgi:hypothetical protein
MAALLNGENLDPVLELINPSQIPSLTHPYSELQLLPPVYPYHFYGNTSSFAAIRTCPSAEERLRRGGLLRELVMGGYAQEAWKWTSWFHSDRMVLYKNTVSFFVTYEDAEANMDVGDWDGDELTGLNNLLAPTDINIAVVRGRLHGPSDLTLFVQCSNWLHAMHVLVQTCPTEGTVFDDHLHCFIFRADTDSSPLVRNMFNRNLSLRSDPLMVEGYFMAPLELKYWDTTTVTSQFVTPPSSPPSDPSPPPIPLSQNQEQNMENNENQQPPP